MRIKYESSDGSLFDSEEECRAYEEKDVLMRQKIKENIIFYNECGNYTMIAYSQCIDEDEFNNLLEKLYDACTVIEVCKDFDENVEEYILSNFGCKLFPSKKGFYCYSELEGWKSFPDAVKEFQETWPMFRISVERR